MPLRNLFPALGQMGFAPSRPADPALFVGLLNHVPLPHSLHEAVQHMEGARYHHGGPQRFKFHKSSAALDECVYWAQYPGPHLEDVRALLGVPRLAALRAWTRLPVCYVVTTLLRRSRGRGERMRQTLPFLRLFVDALQRLPRRFRYRGTLYRGERHAAVQDKWDRVMLPGHCFHLLWPTSFSRSRRVALDFGARPRSITVLKVFDGEGYMMQDFSYFRHEEEVFPNQFPNPFPN